MKGLVSLLAACLLASTATAAKLNMLITQSPWFDGFRKTLVMYEEETGESIEFAVETFQTPLVVVLGHTHCGAVAATLNQIRQPQASRSQHLRSIVERIRPAVEPLSEIWTDLAHEQLLERAIRSNVRMSVNQLRHGSSFLEKMYDSGSLWIVGAEYSLESGEVDFFESQH